MEINILEVKMNLRVVPRNRFDAAFYKVPHYALTVYREIQVAYFRKESESPPKSFNCLLI